MKKVNRTLVTAVFTSVLFVPMAYASTNHTKTDTGSNVIITAGSPQSVSQIQNDVCLFAKKLLQTPPQHRSFDTPEFTQYVYSKVDVQLPRTTLQQSRVGKKITNRAKLEKGDLVFFNLSDSSNEVTFVGIYLGKDMFAGLTTHGLMVINMQSKYWSNKFRFGVRIL